MLRKSSIPLSSQQQPETQTINSTTYQPYSRSHRTVRRTTVRTHGDDNTPSIRLINATPLAAGDSAFASSDECSFGELPAPSASIPTPLRPSSSTTANKRRLVPKKSKLSILSGSTRGLPKELRQDGGKAPDFSDIARRAGASGPARPGFEIHVDSVEDPDLSGLVMVKKQKSRGALDGMQWGSALNDVTNVPKNPDSSGPPTNTSGEDKPKEGSGRWWALSRGRKESKGKEKEQDVNSTIQPAVFKPVPRTEPVKQDESPRKTESRGRFHSLDSSLLLETRTSTALRGRVSSAQMLRISPSPSVDPSSSRPTIVHKPSLPQYPTHVRALTTSTSTMPFSHNPFSDMPQRSTTPTPTMNGLFAPPMHLPTIPVQPELETQTQNASNTGSIAVRAMRSVRSMARLGGWASKSVDLDSLAGAREKEDEPPLEKEGTLKEAKSRTVAKIRKMGSFREKKEVGSVRLKDKLGSVREKKEKTEAVREKEQIEPVREKKEKRGLVREKKDKRKTASLSSSRLLRLSSDDSFEAGFPTPTLPAAKVSATLTKKPAEEQHTLGKKKRSILGLGLGRPSTMRLPSVTLGRSTSTSSSIHTNDGTSHPPVSINMNRVSGGSLSGGILLRSRSGSGAASLRPNSTCSGNSRNSSNSGASVRWDEASLRTARVKRKVEREERRASMDKEGGGTEKKSKKHSSEGKRKTSVMDIWPETRNASTGSEALSSSATASAPSTSEPLPSSARSTGSMGRSAIFALDHATADGQNILTSTPPKRVRPRPVSDQTGTRSTRPAGMYENPGQALSILDAATKDLALLINTLDLEATPHATPDMTPNRRYSNPPESPTKYLLERVSPLSSSSRARTLRPSEGSVASLRSAVAAKALSAAPKVSVPPLPTMPIQTGRTVSQRIAPWPAADTELSPLKVQNSAAEAPSSRPVKRSASRSRAMTPSPAPDTSPRFRPLRPSASRRALHNESPTRPRNLTIKAGLGGFVGPVFSKERINSMMTFGSGTSSRNTSLDLGAQPVFTKPPGHKQKQSSLSSSMVLSNSHIQREWAPAASSTPPSDSEMRRVLGLKGTMGESDESDGAQDSDSDIPDELQAIIGVDSPAMRSSVLSLPPSAPPPFPLPSTTHFTSNPPSSFRLPAFPLSSPLDQDTMLSISQLQDTDDTKKSFDFTEEIKRLSETGSSSRRSFVEQLEHAFKTPAKADLKYRFEVEGEESFFKLVNAFGQNGSAVPPVPRIDSKYLQPAQSISGLRSQFDDSFTELPFEENQPSGSGELNKNFKFGGRSPPPQSDEDSMDVDLDEHPHFAQPAMTLADIIPPPTLQHSPSPSVASTEEDLSVLNSIYEKARQAPALDALLLPRPRVSSDTSVHRMSARFSRAFARDSFFGPSARTSVLSFTGFESFDQVRRGFEFHENRPNFYPPPTANSRSFSSSTNRRAFQDNRESMMSVASISPMGHAHNNRFSDGFENGLYDVPERPTSENFSRCMSNVVDDTFSFMRNVPPRERADSDASNFYFRPSASANSSAAYNARRRESGMSFNSLAPPVSLYNRAFTGHRIHHSRNDSSNSFSSPANYHSSRRTSGGRAAWARHHQDASVDSVASDFSALRLGRPGIGEKMFGSSSSEGSEGRLTSIMASPHAESEEGGYSSGRSYDSIMDGSHSSSVEDDSLFEKTRSRSIPLSDDSIFRPSAPVDTYDNPASEPYRPISVMSLVSEHPPEHQDDTMISMLGGGHVRRLSLCSVVHGSPCINKRKFSHLRNEYRDEEEEPQRESPKKARIVEKRVSFAPSVASISSFKFGEERMARAAKGHFSRDSLEETCLSGEGEECSTSARPALVFSRPLAFGRSRSSTTTASSSGVNTPSLSSYDDSSQSEGGSVSSIDLSEVNSMLVNTVNPLTSGARVRARARGRGHRRPVSQLYRSSVYETIEEEQGTLPRPLAVAPKSPPACEAIRIVDPQSPEYDAWHNEQGVETLRRYYALRDEVEHTVNESKQLWVDTPYSLFAMQSFNIPRNPAAMRALLEHSLQNYGSLPSELCDRPRSRKSSRASPYPTRSPRCLKDGNSSDSHHESDVEHSPALPLQKVSRDPNLPLRSRSNVHKTWDSPDVVKAAIKPRRENVRGLAPSTRPLAGSPAQRGVLGSTKKSYVPKASTRQKENAVNVGQGTLITPSDGLRINRPRPKGRPAAATTRLSRF